MKHLITTKYSSVNQNSVKTSFSRIFAIILSVCSILPITILTAATTSAISESTLDFYDKNGIYYYNPDGFSQGCYAGLGSYDGITTAGLTDLQASFIDTYHGIAEQLSAEYGIPWETVIAQGIIESASGTSNFARERNNFFGIGAFDSNPNAAKSYSSPQEGWKGYYENIVKTPTYRAHGAFDYPNDPYKYLEAIKAAGYATDPNYVQKVGEYIKAIENRAKEKGWALSSDAGNSSKLLSSINDLLNPTGSGLNSSINSKTNSASTYHGCNSSTQGNGDINQTALDLSWPDRTHGVRDPKPEYTKALEEVGLNNYGDEWVKIGSSCDAFVATVMRFSGADPDIVCCGAANILNYLATHPDLYEEIPNLDNSSNLQPGDIRARPSHVEIYVVDESGNGRIASASHGDRTADHARDFYANSEYRVFRFKGFNK